MTGEVKTRIIEDLCDRFNTNFSVESYDPGFLVNSPRSQYKYGENLGRVLYFSVNPSFLSRRNQLRDGLPLKTKDPEFENLVLETAGHFILEKAVMRFAGLIANEEGAPTVLERQEELKNDFSTLKIFALIRNSVPRVFLLGERMKYDMTAHQFRKLVRMPLLEAAEFLQKTVYTNPLNHDRV